MRKDKKSLYENIMSAVSKEVKKILNETINDELHISYEKIESADILSAKRIGYLIEYAKEWLKNGYEDPDFLSDWIYKMERAKRNNRVIKYTSADPGHNSLANELYDLINGNAYFVYDLIQYGLSSPTTTVPRRLKLSKMLDYLFD